eukprot:3964651-Pleurochrysis_carterae.AAC.2
MCATLRVRVLVCSGLAVRSARVFVSERSGGRAAARARASGRRLRQPSPCALAQQTVATLQPSQRHCVLARARAWPQSPRFVTDTLTRQFISPRSCETRAGRDATASKRLATSLSGADYFGLLFVACSRGQVRSQFCVKAKRKALAWCAAAHSSVPWFRLLFEFRFIA